MADDLPPALTSLPHLVIHRTTLSADLTPVAASAFTGDAGLGWWEQDPGTAGHARHCQPLAMANTLGWYILSPGEFTVRWDGGDTAAVVESQDCDGLVVDSHSARGSFTLQPGFIPVTGTPGDFVLIKGCPNLRRPWFAVMEALIETWWQAAEFGLVCLLTHGGEFHVARGQPVAQMMIYRAEGGFASLSETDELPAFTEQWRTRRGRPEYRKDFDYVRGRYPDGTVEPTHLYNWDRVPQFLSGQDEAPSAAPIPATRQ
jgi:Family of unknown function (DUF6065)